MTPQASRVAKMVRQEGRQQRAAGQQCRRLVMPRNLDASDNAKGFTRRHLEEDGPGASEQRGVTGVALPRNSQPVHTKILLARR